MKISIINKISQKNNYILDNKLWSYNQRELNFTGEKERQICYIIRQQDKIIAGIKASLEYSWVLYISRLFVEEEFRRLGLGSLLLKKAEEEAKKIGAFQVQLETFDFQAKDFYLKNNYETFAVLDNCPLRGHKRFYMKKILVN